MKNVILCFVLGFLSFSCFAQSENKPPRLAKTAIGDSGCFAYLPDGMADFELEKSEDGSDVYTAEVEVGGHSFGCIAVKFAEPATGSTPEEMQQLLVSYMDFIQQAFEITSAVGAGKGHTLEGFPDAIGVIDFWENAAGIEYAVKGWVNQKYLGFLYIAGQGDYPFFNLQQMYLDGFRFGE